MDENKEINIDKIKKITLEFEIIDNGFVVRFVDTNKKHYFKDSWGIGKYIQDEFEKTIDGLKKKRTDD